MRHALVAAILCVFGATAAPANGSVIVGIADQQLDPLTDQLFAWTGIRTVRMLAPWDAALVPSPELDARLGRTRAAGVDVVVAFEHRRGEDCRTTACTLPSPEQLRAAFRAFRARWPWVTEFGAWNEGNHPSQPTANRPPAAAGLYRVLAGECPECRIAAAEVVDSSNMTGWLRAFLAALPEPPRLWALHNYGDVTRGRTTMTEAMLALVDGDVWLTETGGIVSWTRWPYDEARARDAVERAFALADAHPDRIPRVYLYQWRAGADEAWDSGLLRPDGTPRPSFHALAERLRPGHPVPPVRAATPVARGPALRVMRAPWVDRRGIVRARVACAPFRSRSCAAALVARRRPARAGHRRPAALAADRRPTAPARTRTLRIRLPTGTRRAYVELRLPGRRPVHSTLRVPRRRDGEARAMSPRRAPPAAAHPAPARAAR